MQCKRPGTYAQHKVAVAVLLYALTPLCGVRTPSYTARDDEVAVPLVGGCPHVYIEGGPPRSTYTYHKAPTEHAHRTSRTARGSGALAVVRSIECP